MKVTQKAAQPVDQKKDAFLRAMNFKTMSLEQVCAALDYISTSYDHEAVNPVSQSCFLPADYQISRAKVALLFRIP